ncbi:hypothetical protein QF049_004352 [Paenibacillus sp. W4I10]|nr:hypothetical protein [Paenibacillus sp. W4I10]
MKLRKIMAILLFSVMIVSTFPTIEINVQDQIYRLLTHGSGTL